MSQYNPDVWVIVELSGSKVESRYHRVLAGWYGGYGGSDRWKISSGITKIVDKDNYWEIHNTSGSIYNCHKEYERFSGYTQNVFQSYFDENTEELAMNHVTLESVLEQYQS